MNEPNAAQKIRDRRSRSREMVEKLVAERTEMLALYCKVAGLEPYHENKPVKALKEFCQVIVDYVAAGHFALYERIIEGKERRKQLFKLAEELYPQIAEVSESVVSFSDKYDSEESEQELDTLSSDLSRLGEQIANRIELEDRLISRLY